MLYDKVCEQMIRERISFIREEIKKSCQKAGRRQDNIKLICVTKQANLSQVREAIQCGISAIGESRVQQAKLRKIELNADIAWHMIGHLQKNKAAQAIEIFDCIHSIDSVELAQVIEKYCANKQRKMDILLEVNIANEPTKYGFKPAELFFAIEQILKLGHLNITGLMAMAPETDNPEHSRPYFAELKSLRDKINVPQIVHLSMGMSQDYTVAIEEGADMIRLGSIIFGDLTCKKQT